MSRFRFLFSGYFYLVFLLGCSTIELQNQRNLLTYGNLMDGFEDQSPVSEVALTMPEGAPAAQNQFEGRLELIGEAENGDIQVTSGAFDPTNAHLPEFDFDFVQDGSYLIPVQRGLIITEHPYGITSSSQAGSGKNPATRVTHEPPFLLRSHPKAPMRF